MINFVTLFTLIMKKFLLVFLTFASFLGFAQLDTDHWFAPMAAKGGNSGAESYLYLSTNETTPFTVNIYNNNTVYTTATISKGFPAQVFIPETFMMGLNQSELFTPVTKGIYAKGPKKFFANYRFSITNHAEIITSKGLAGLGTTFYAAMAPNTGTAPYVNSTIGVIATEDNTTVTISGYDPAVVFSDGTSSLTKTFTLNKGQSYMLDAVSVTSPSNLAGLIGAKIVANLPISVTNGNFNGIYTNFNFTNNDILMDQSVPVDRLGNNFVVVKGNASAGSGMETPLVVATEDNTQISVNGNPVVNILNEGDYMMIDGVNYVNQGNNHFNMGITSNKNVYVYQLLGGTASGSVYATGGFNYIPPLSCFLPNKVDEIGDINSIGLTTYGTKLNIITQAGAVVTLNGTAIAAVNGPYPVTGNANWVTYSVPNVSGNVTVNSTKSVTAGIAAGSGAVGYGGYFAGFSSVPVIVKTGDCYSGVLLQVDNSYDAYQWFLNGVAIPGATTFSINPELYGAGNYTVLITKNLCESKLTDPYAFALCPPITTSTQNIGSCNLVTITPAFTNSSQAINPALTQIIAPPASGTASVNATTGVVTYSPAPGLTADTQVQFVYYIEGTGTPQVFEYFRVFVNIDVLQTTNASIVSCADANGNGTFDLTSVSLTPDSGTTVNFFTNANLTGPIATPTVYNGPAGTVYAAVTSSYGCIKPAQIQLTVNPTPNINTANFNGAVCDDNLDGVVPVNFATVTPQIVTNAAQFDVRYYLVQADATAGNANTLPANWSFSAPTTVYVRVDPLTGNCPAVFGQLNFSIADKVPLLTLDHTTTLCDPDGNGSEQANLNNYKNSFTIDPAVTLTFYSTLADAQNATNPVNATQTVTGTGVFYIRFQGPNACANVAKLTLNLQTLNVFPAALSACGNAAGSGTFDLTTANITTNTGVTPAYFSDAALTVPIANPASYTAPASTVYVQVSTGSNCSAVAAITLSVIPLPNINVSGFNGALCDDDFDGTVQVNFSTITPQIVTNSGSFNVRYYLVQANATAGNNNNLPNNWSYTATTTVYVRVDSNTGNCPPAFGQLVFSIGNKIVLTAGSLTTEVCDNDLNGSEQVNLAGFITLFTANPGITASYHNSLTDAQNDVNAVSATQLITGTHTFFIRFESNSGCPNTAQLTVNLKAPKKSDVLKDVTICPGSTTVLDAGSGFTSYLWSNGATTPTVSVGVGSYYVDLGFNGCKYRQFVNVIPAQQPVITSIDVKGDVVTINVTGGTPPYQYSLDGLTWQNSNVFMGVSKGVHTAYVRSVEKCRPVTKDFLVLDLINAITPNGDGVNDVLDYTDLSSKENVSIQVFDRYGATMHQSKGKNYIWDGKVNGRVISSGTYWYLLKWTDPQTKEPVEYSGWILLKNRE